EPVFDFQGFLVQLRSRSAEPIQKYLKSFLVSFAKRPFTINDQIKLIHDFLEFIAEKMRQTDPWKGQSEAEFEQSMEAMEKLVMNRLYTYTFSPMIDHSVYPITTDDLEKDFVLSERIRIFSWVREKHLDVPEGEASQGFLAFAEQGSGRIELLKINHYKAPRDKMICILNCCKVIFGLIRHVAGSDNTSADAFLPILIFVVIRANPDNMISNIEYINRFRSAQRLQGEAGYYLSSLGGTISFIETMDASGLSNITREEFEENVGRAVAEMPPAEPRNARGPQGPNSASTVNAAWSNTAEGEEPARDLTSLPGNIALDTKRFFQRTGEFATEAVSRPLSALGKMIESIGGTADEEGNDYPGSAYRQPSYRGGDRGETPRTPSFQNRIRAPRPVYRSPSGQGQKSLPTASPLGGLMTPSDDPTFNFTELTAEIDRNTTTARQAGIDTLHQMFPDIDREIAGVILDSCQNDLGQAIDR
ncbi:hypothetical protein HD553DRAFT_270955, partial [Filobasidium floriforme]|uniref:uncharacterized protein n=1 Tax=Filobasidium floriforme TaxID=5210 RepID=UPI001E8DCA95